MFPSRLFCTACGAENQAQDAFCVVCGRPLRRTASLDLYALAAAADGTQTGFLAFYHLLKQRYRILGQLGRGGMGTVYKAEDTQFGSRLVAVKEMTQEGLSSQQEFSKAAKAFEREALMLANLRHQNLPRIYDYFSESKHCYLVMDFIEGETLAKYLTKTEGSLAVEEVLQIGIQLCTVLDYLHMCQPPIVFRDLKPANLMRTADGHLYLIDFGIARHFKPGQTRDTMAFVSSGYASPEQYGNAQTTPRSDIYSLGAMLHQMLSGMDPAERPFRFVPLQASGRSIPASLARIVMQMLDMDDTRRPASMHAVKQELQRIASRLARDTSVTTQAVERTLPSTIQHFQGRRRIFGVISTVVIIILLAVSLVPAVSAYMRARSSAPNNTHSVANSTLTRISLPTATPSPTPMQTAVSGGSNRIYPAPDQGLDFTTWNRLSDDWSVSQTEIHSNGGDRGTTPTIIAPMTLQVHDHKLVSKIQVLWGTTCFSLAVGGSISNGEWNGYKGSVCVTDNWVTVARIEYRATTLSSRVFDPGTRAYTYTLAVKLDTITFSAVDANNQQAFSFSFQDNRVSVGDQVGFEAYACAISVTSAEIFKD
jgi:serine/threonine protein kinase